MGTEDLEKKVNNISIPSGAGVDEHL